MWVKSEVSEGIGHDTVKEYKNYLRDGQAVLVDLLSEMQWQTAGEDQLSTAKDWAHRIAGNAAMFGYVDLGDTARDLEIYLKLSEPARDQDGVLVRLIRLTNMIAEVVGPLEGSKNQFSISSDGFDPTKPPRAANKPVILMAEGDERLVKLVMGMLSAEADFIHCVSSVAALSKAQIDNIDLAIIDEALLDGMGYDVVQKLRALEPLKNIPVIMTLHSDDPDRMVRAYQAGASTCVPKPYGPHAFAEKIREQIDRQTPGILLVDDDPIVQSLLKPKFEAEGLQVWTASNGQAALSILSDTEPALIVLDRMMPGLGGADVLSRLKGNPKLNHIPVMMLTTDTGGSDAHEWLKRGAVDFIAKPFNPAEVVLRALRYIDRDQAA